MNNTESKDEKQSTSSKKKKSKSDGTFQFRLTIDAKDERIQEIFDRVKGEGLRADFVKEAIYHYSYVVDRAPKLRSGFLSSTKKEDINEDEIIYLSPNTVEPPMSKEGRKNISLRITISNDDEELKNILSRVTLVQDYVREAIDNWDYILHTTSFHSRYINLEKDTEKKFYNYGTIHNKVSSEYVVKPSSSHVNIDTESAPSTSQNEISNNVADTKTTEESAGPSTEENKTINIDEFKEPKQEANHTTETEQKVEPPQPSPKRRTPNSLLQHIQ